MGQIFSVLLTVYIGIGLLSGMILSGLTMVAPQLHGDKTESLDQIPWYDWLAVWLVLLFFWPLMAVSAVIIRLRKREEEDDV